MSSRSDDAIAPAQLDNHEQLRRRCHYLVDAIAARPGSTKLLRGILPVLQTYASYKQGKRSRRGSG